MDFRALIIAAACLSALACARPPAGQAPQPVAAPPVAATPAAASSAPNATEAPASRQVVPGDQAEFQRQALRDDKAVPVAPQDIAAGPLLDAGDAAAQAAADAVRGQIAALKRGDSIAASCTLAGSAQAQRFFAPYGRELASVQSVRFLAAHALDERRAAFELLLKNGRGGARIQWYLARKSPSDGWLTSDVQGSLAGLSQAAQSDYTGYVPTTIDRRLILEGR